MSIARPGGGRRPVEKSKVELAGGAPLLRGGETDHAGAYEVTIETEPPTQMRFAAQMDPDESKLDPMPDADMKSLGDGTQVVHWEPGTDMRQALGWQRNGREFWMVLAALALCVACCESFLSGRFSAEK